MAKTDRSRLMSNDQEYGMLADPNKLEDSITHAYDVIDENDNGFKTHKTATTIDHPDKSVTEAKLGDKSVSRRTIQKGAVGAEELDDALINYYGDMAVKAKLDEHTSDLAQKAQQYYVDVKKDYGAKGDGISDDTQAIKNALTYLQTNGGTIFFPKGIYIISSQLTPPSNITLIGEDPSLSIIKRGDNLADIDDTENCNFYCSNVTNLTMKNLTIDANGDNQPTDILRTSCVIMLGTCDNWVIDNVNFINARGTYVNGVVTGGYGLVCWNLSKNVKVSNCTFENIGQSDLGLFSGENWVVTNIVSRDNGYMPINVESGNGTGYIRNIVINGWTSFGAGHSLISVIRSTEAANYVQDVIISNVTGYDVCRLGGTVGGIIVKGTERTSLSNIRINGCGSYGLHVKTDGGYSTIDLSVSNLQMEGITGANSYGVYLYGSSTNKIINANLDNIRVKQTPNIGLYARYCDGLKIANSTIENSGGGRGTQLLSCTRSSIVNSHVRGNQTYGICIDSSQYIELNGNIVTNNTSRGIQLQSTSNYITISNNQCYDDQSTKTQTMGIMVEVTTPSPVVLISNNMVKGNGSNGIRWNATDLSNMVITGNIDDLSSSYNMHQKTLLSNGASSWKVSIDATGNLITTSA